MSADCPQQPEFPTPTVRQVLLMCAYPVYPCLQISVTPMALFHRLAVACLVVAVAVPQWGADAVPTFEEAFASATMFATVSCASRHVDMQIRCSCSDPCSCLYNELLAFPPFALMGTWLCPLQAVVLSH